jgi:hypothetical protein
MASKYNRLARPIAVLGFRSAYMHLCEFVGVNPHNNDLFFHVHDYTTASRGEFSRVIGIDGAEDTIDYLTVKSLAEARITNDSTAKQSNIGYGNI